MIIFKLVWRRIRASLGSLLLTLIAIVAGVGFVSGSFILSDSLAATFNSIFEDAASTVDGQVQPKEAEFGFEPRTIPDTLATELQELPEVRKATPQVVYSNDSVNNFIATDADGQEVYPQGSEQGPPVLTASWDGEEGGGLLIADGVVPNGIDEVALNQGYADLIPAAVGDEIEFVTPDGRKTFTVTATVELTTGGAAFVLFDFESAQALYGKEGLVDTVSLSTEPGTTVEEMLAAVEAALPEDAEVIDQADVVAENVADFNQVIGIIRNVLLGFAGVALFVSLFIIYNTFAVLITQRMRQIGMLRAIGATRAQIRNSIVIEAFAVGLIGSILGLAAGFLFALLIKAGFQAAGGFPETKNVLLPRTIIAAFSVGILAAVLSSLLPAVLAGRVSPIAAMRNERSQEGVFSSRVVAGAIVLVLGMVLLGLGLAGQSTAIGSLGETTVLLIELGVGAIAIFLGVAMLSIIFAGPLADLLGKGGFLGATMLGLGVGLLLLIFGIGDGVPDSVLRFISFAFKVIFAALGIILGTSIIVSVLRGGKATGIGGSAGALEGHLARRNASRSPQRTSATAMALTIGITLVTTVGIIGQSLKESVSGALERGVQADLFIYDNSFGSFESAVTTAIEEVDGIEQATGIRQNEVKIGTGDGGVVGVTAYDTTSGTDLIDPAVDQGQLGDVAPNGLLVSAEYADEQGYEIGDVIPVEFPNGNSQDFTVAATFTDTAIIDSQLAIDITAYDDNFSDDKDLFVAASLAEGSDEDRVRSDVEAITDEAGTFTVQNTGEYLESLSGQVDGLTSLINYMLGFALFVAFIGVVNTIVLSVVERTREIGLLRAVGGTRRQIRSMVRWESVMVCLLGALVGVGLGVLFAQATVAAIPDSFIDRLSLPWETLVFTLLIASLAGMVAAVIPAFMASRRSPLEAISSAE